MKRVLKALGLLRTSRWPASTNSTASRAKCTARSSPVAWTIAGSLKSSTLQKTIEGPNFGLWKQVEYILREKSGSFFFLVRGKAERRRKGDK